MHARRALLYMPGDDRHKIEKALTLGVDCICMDMEDAVALNRKEAARHSITQALNELDFGRSEKLARINPVGSGLEADDLEVVLPARPDGIVIPKAESAEQLEWVNARIEAAEKEHGWPVGSICTVALIESARAIIDLKQIAAMPRLEALIFGADDYAVSIGATRSRAGWEVLHARSSVVMHAAANGLQSIDMVYIDFRDPVNLKIEAAQGAQMGFTGKQIIHPNQVQPVQEAFTPSAESLAQAQQIVDAFEQHQSQGAGAFDLDGRMIDMPTVKAAQQVLERSKAAGK
jgi:citrate lyase subunit beta-like protein